MAPPPESKCIGVMGGSFNPIHLGHALLAITVRETKPVDEVLLVPVFKHPVKKDLLPFEDRLAMCKLAVSGSHIGVSSVEEETGESNAVMLRALRKKYPKGSRLLWVCGDDVFDWISNEKGQAMLAELDGLIVQRRLHKATDSQTDRFYKAPVDSDKVRALVAEHQVHVDFIYGELPHYSSTLVRNSPASWRAFLPQKVAAYLDERPALLAQLVRTGDAPATHLSPPASPLDVNKLDLLKYHEPVEDEIDLGSDLQNATTIMLNSSTVEIEVLEETSDSTAATKTDVDMPRILGRLTPTRTPRIMDKSEECEVPMAESASTCSRRSRSQKSRTPRMPSKQRLREASTACVMRCLATVHALQRERGHTALALSLKDLPKGEIAAKCMRESRAAVDFLLKGEPEDEKPLRLAGLEAGACGAVAEELRRTPMWLSYDRALLDRHFEEEAINGAGTDDPNCWMRRTSLVDKFNVRVDVLIDACTNALRELLAAGTADGYLQVWTRSDSYDGFAKGQICHDDDESTGEWLLSLFKQYADCKEALGRLRGFVCCGGQNAPELVRNSFRARRRLNEVIEDKDRMLRRVLSTEQAGPNSAEHPGAHTAAALHKMLGSVTVLERQLMGCFARSTPLEVMHEALKAGCETGRFDVHDWFRTLSSAIDLMVNLDQALAAFICTYSEGEA